MITQFKNFKSSYDLEDDTEETLKEKRKKFLIPDSNFNTIRYLMNENKEITEYYVDISKIADISFSKNKDMLNIKIQDTIFEKRKIIKVGLNGFQKNPYIQFDDFKIDFKIDVSNYLFENINYSISGDKLTFHIKINNYYEDQYPNNKNDLKNHYNNIDLFGKYINI